jgi:hypothetical protein
VFSVTGRPIQMPNASANYSIHRAVDTTPRSAISRSGLSRGYSLVWTAGWPNNQSTVSCSCRAGSRKVGNLHRATLCVLRVATTRCEAFACGQSPTQDSLVTWCASTCHLVGCRGTSTCHTDQAPPLFAWRRVPQNVGRREQRSSSTP